MAEFLAQDEIDVLLDICDDSDANERDRKLDEAEVEEIGAIRFSGTQGENLKPLVVGNEGYLKYKSKYGREQFGKFRIVQISDSGNIAVLTDTKLDSMKVKVSEIEDRLYKYEKMYELHHMKDAYLEMVEKLNDRFDLSPKGFLDKIEEVKKGYPEIWL